MPNWTDEQRRNAATIVSVGRSVGASDRDILIALMTASVESNLVNVNYGDRDSLGLFQQRAPWGSVEQRMNPRESARMFFLGGNGGQPGLFDKSNRNQMSMGEAAQAVQVSAFPDRYATREDSMRSLMGEIGVNYEETPQVESTDPLSFLDTTDPQAMAVRQASTTGELDETGELGMGGLADPGASADLDAGDWLPLFADQQDFMSTLGDIKLPGVDRPVAPAYATGLRKRVVDEGMGYLGLKYVWGGTSKQSGVDCSGLVQSVLATFGIEAPRISYAQAQMGKRVNINQLQPGDLVAWDNSTRNNGADHIAFYLGDGKILEAPRPGGQVQIRSLDDDEGDIWGVDLSSYYG